MCIRDRQKVLRSMIEEVAFAVSTNESRPVHTGALFEIADMCLNMVAVDGFRLAFRREKLAKLEGGAFSFVCPGSALNEVKSICGDTAGLVTITLGKRHILFEIGDTQLICRRLEGEFLDYQNAIPQMCIRDSPRCWRGRRRFRCRGIQSPGFCTGQQFCPWSFPCCS